MVIEPTNYKIAVSLAEAAVKQADANAQNAAREAKRRARLKHAGSHRRGTADLHAASATATAAQYQQALANLEQARVNSIAPRSVPPSTDGSRICGLSSATM